MMATFSFHTIYGMLTQISVRSCASNFAVLTTRSPIWHKN